MDSMFQLFIRSFLSFSNSSKKALPSRTMNKLALIVVFSSGVLLAISVSLLATYIQNENLRHRSSEQDVKDLLIVSRRKAFEQSQAIASIPDESQLSVVPETLLYLNVLTGKENDKSSASTFDVNTGAVLEALAALNAALDMNKQQKHGKAVKLFQHALALSPKHPDILTHYGEFLEETERNLLEADRHYSKALVFSPSHRRALTNHQRTSPLVDELDNNLLERIDRKRDDLLNVPHGSSGLKRVKKEAYFQYIYHTLGIEGNTMSLAQTRSILETRMAVAGKSIMEHNEILGMDAALKFVNSTLVHRIGAITFEDILEIHRRVLGFVDIFEGGRLRTTQVFVGSHIPPGPTEVQLLMNEFIQWLNHAETLSLHPIRFAALAHYKLVYIHPFSDGNGRTSRLLMNLILMQAGYPPVIIRKQDREKYYEFLQQANEGDVRPFIRFIAQCAEQTLDVYLWATTEHGTDVPELAQEDDGRTIMVGHKQECCVGG